jgi:hypothetical protein
MLIIDRTNGSSFVVINCLPNSVVRVLLSGEPCTERTQSAAQDCSHLAESANSGPHPCTASYMSTNLNDEKLYMTNGAGTEKL